MSKILMIDDDKMLLELMQEQIEESGHMVLTATTPSEAKRLFQDTSPDLVIIDVIIPGLDGLELLRQLKVLNPSFRAIILSGLDDRDLQDKAKKFGADLYLTKPVPADDFMTAINRLVAKEL